MVDRIIFPADAIEETQKRLKQISYTIDELLRGLDVVKRGVAEKTLKQSKVLDDLNIYGKRLALASQEAQQLSRAMGWVRDDFLNCEESTKQDLRRISDMFIQLNGLFAQVQSDLIQSPFAR